MVLVRNYTCRLGRASSVEITTEYKKTHEHLMSTKSDSSRRDGAYEDIKRHSRWIMVAFFLALMFFAARNLSNDRVELENAAQMHGWVESSVDISETVHQLQRERGMSSGYLASGGVRFRSGLATQHQATDVALTKLYPALQRQNITPSAWSLDADAIRKQFVELRSEVLALQISRDIAADRYTTLIDRLFALLLSRANADGAMLRPQLAFISFLQAKELSGKERALLTAMLSSGEFHNAARLAAHQRLRVSEAVRLDQFNTVADADARRGYAAIVKDEFTVEIEAIRERVMTMGQGKSLDRSAWPTAEHWFAVSTLRIDAMKNLEDTLAAANIRQATTLEDRARQSLLENGFGAVASLLLAGLLLWQIRRGSKEAEAELHLADMVFESSVESIVITDPDFVIVEVNPAFSRITGFMREEVIGQHVRMLKSGRHDAAFYQAMWETMARDGAWDGEIWNRRKNGDIYPSLLSIVAVKNTQDAITHYLAMNVDLSQRKKAEELLEQLRTFDPLTGLLSREAWYSALDRAVANSRGTTLKFAVLEIGLDRFKMINDSISHAVGDMILVEAAARIKSVLRRYDVPARPGGDRFSVLLEEIKAPQDVGTICEKLIAAFEPAFSVADLDLHVSISIGATLFPDDGDQMAVLHRNAESAMYRSKNEGRGTYRFYSSEMNVEGARQLEVEGLLRQALKRGEFTVFYQPQVDAVSNALVGVEALLRWNSPELGSISPVQFIPIAEETGLIVSIGEWVLRESCLQVRRWIDELGCEIPVAVNLSARQFTQKDLLQTIQSALDGARLAPHLLELEITEGSLISDPVGASDVLHGIRAMGMRTALDDFGTGYSSLAYLKTFPLDRLKIDRAFVRDLPDDQSDVAISRAVVALGRNLNMEVLAEGVETLAQQVFLAESGCHILQGYLHGKPMSAEDIAHRLHDGSLLWPAGHSPVSH